MVHISPDHGEDDGEKKPDHGKNKPRRSGGYLLSLRSFVLLLVSVGVVVLAVHDPRLGVAVFGGVAMLAALAKLIK